MTRQIPERLMIEGKQSAMYSFPSFPMSNKRFLWPGTALYRGYIGTWEIRKNRLYLIGLRGRLEPDGEAIRAINKESAEQNTRCLVKRILLTIKAVKKEFAEPPGSWGWKYKNGTDANLESFFPGFPERVFAHWFSGVISLPEGRSIYGDRFGSVSEQDVLLTFERGVMIKGDVWRNGYDETGEIKSVHIKMFTQLDEYDIELNEYDFEREMSMLWSG